MKTPDVTPAQTGALTAAVAAVVATVQAAPERLQVPLLAAIALVAAAWIVSDALVRRGRAGIEAARVSATSTLPADSADQAVPHLVYPEEPTDADGDDRAHGA